MVKSYLEFAKNLNDLTHRMEVLTKLCTLASGAEFYASDLGLSGQDMNSLQVHWIVNCVKGKEKFKFIPIDSCGELYKKVEVKCWTMEDKFLTNDFRRYCNDMAAMYSAQAERL